MFAPLSHPPRVVVVGYGFAGRSFHTYLVGLAPGLVLQGVCARDPERRVLAAAERGCATYADFDAVLADPAVDLVVLATPNHTHAPLAIRALEAGKHVVTDKIMCLSLAECDAMIAAARRQQRYLSVFQNRRWDGDFLTLRRLLVEGALGDLRWLEMAWQGPRPMARWRAQAAQGGGRLHDLGAHLVDQALLVFPQPVTSVYARLHHDYPETDTESHALVVIRFEHGATAVIDTGSMHYASKPRFYAAGSLGTWVKHGLDPQEAAMKAGDIDSARELESDWGMLHDAQGARPVPTLPGRWRNYYELVAAQLTGQAPPVPPVELAEVRRAIAAIEAARASARTDQVVTLATA
jgi:scyllo-inositol 2-dehydrogenase (NADP+)